MSDSESDGAKAEELYDPNQDPEEKSRIREGYRVQLKDLEGFAAAVRHKLLVSHILLHFQSPQKTLNTLKSANWSMA